MADEKKPDEKKDEKNPEGNEGNENAPDKETSKVGRFIMKYHTFLSSFVIVHLGASRQAANDTGKRTLLSRKEVLEEKIDTLKYQKAAMDPAEYKKQLTSALVELARVQQELDK